jgi:hypothetical protein
MKKPELEKVTRSGLMFFVSPKLENLKFIFQSGSVTLINSMEDFPTPGEAFCPPESISNRIFSDVFFVPPGFVPKYRGQIGGSDGIRIRNTARN